MDYKKLPNESENDYVLRVCQDKLNLGTWDNVADIINAELDKNCTESKYRKRFKKSGLEFNPIHTEAVDDSYKNSEFEKQRRLLEREKIKFRDERRAWNKQNYIDARVEEKLDLLEDKLSNIGRTVFLNHTPVEINSDNDMLIILSDFHIGATYSSVWGEYNVDIAKDRLNKLLAEVFKIQKRHNSQRCYISLQGDLISGNIHKTVQITNSEDVIEQIKIATELVCGFAYEVSKIFKSVFVSSVVGNHSRIDKKEEALHSERLDDLIIWGTRLCLNGVGNIHILDRKLDNGISDMNIRGKMYINVHGDYDTYNHNGVSKLCMLLGFIPYAITFGHMHTCAVDETNGVKMIRGGSLGGSGDDYTVEKRLSGKASQMVCICDDKGVVCYYPIEL